MKITKAWLTKKGACYQGKAWFVSNFPNGGEPADVFAKLNRTDWFGWLSGHIFTPKQSVWLACIAARQALKFVPAGETRPLTCIETVEAYVKGEKTLDDVEAAREAASEAASEAAWAASAAAREAAREAAIRQFLADVVVEMSKPSFKRLGENVVKRAIRKVSEVVK